MIASVSVHMTANLPDTSSVPLRSDAGSAPSVPTTPLSAPQSAPVMPSLPAASTSGKSIAQDTVALSNTALDMSRALNEQADKRSELKKEAAKQQTDEKAQTAYLAAGKAFPPFMGNSEELKALKESSPALYREVLRMIVPPPINLSPTELQMLQEALYNVVTFNQNLRPLDKEVVIMSISQVSPSSLATNSPYVNPYAKTTETQPGAIQQNNQDAQKPVRATQTDTVTISQQALQMAAGSDNSKPEDTQSSTGNNSSGSSNAPPSPRQPGSFSAQA